jgi:hypothetical protein
MCDESWVKMKSYARIVVEVSANPKAVACLPSSCDRLYVKSNA